MQTVDGFTHFVNENEETVFTLGSLFAVDANGKPTDALTYDFVPVKGNDDQVIVTVTLDNDYLTAADRAFPVVIDPTVTVTVSSSQTADTCVCSYFPSTNYYLGTNLRTGYDSDYGIRRSYLRFEIPDSITTGSIIDATLDLEKVSGVVPTVRAYRVTSSWSSSTLTWNNKPGHTTSGQSSQSVVFREGSAWYTMNVMSIVNNWVNGYSLNYGFVLIDNTENNANHWTTYYSSDAVSPHKPELIITYSESGGITPPPNPDPEPEPECNELSLSNSTTTMQIGQTYAFSADARPAGVTVTWESSDPNVATVNASGIVTALDIGSTTITARSGSKSASCTVKVEPTGGYRYEITVSNYYDNGFNNNINSIQAANNNTAKRLARIFQLKLYSNYYPYTSLADNCKARRHPYESTCPAPEPCYSPEALRAQFIIDKGEGADKHSLVLWSSHTPTSNYSSGSDPNTKTVVIIPMPHMNHSDNYQFMHELSHQIGSKDHYCKLVGGICVNEYCLDHGIHESVSETCIMVDSSQLDSATDQALFCDACKSSINDHLSEHHLIDQN